MSVRFRFTNDKEESTLPCDQYHISAFELKREIVRARRFGRITEFDLRVTDSAGKTYDKDTDLIPKNSSLVVSRYPLPKGQKKVWEEEVLPTAAATAAAAAPAATDAAGGPAITGASFATGEDQTEEDKLKVSIRTGYEATPH